MEQREKETNKKEETNDREMESKKNIFCSESNGQLYLNHIANLVQRGSSSKT